jgi:TolB-like protein/DNA-binding winged helix-turn-helix (wHTH) protein/Tfp pilus assembly protein PilF
LRVPANYPFVQPSFAFGSFEIRPTERLVLVGGTPAPVGARAFDVLMALVERRDRVVSKKELLDLAWAGLVVEDANLTVQISALRKVLGTGVIVTVTGRGYRFALDVDSGQHDVPPLVQQGAAERAATNDRIERRVATLAAAGVLDWQHLVARNAGAAISAWRALRNEVIEPRIPLFGGRIIELTADGLLAEFESAVDALAWALDLQQHGRPDGAGGDALQALPLRVAVHADDVVVDEGRLLGEGVHETARLMHLADAGQVLASDVVRVLAQKKASLSFARMPASPDGTAVWLVRRDDVSRPGPAARAVEAGQHASLAVLPFGGEASDADRYFGDGITEEIITALSLNRSFFVISRNSTLRYRGSMATPAEIARELGVRYLLGGTARRHSGRLRITAELIDALGDRVIWGTSHDGEEEELFEFQVRIASSIAAAIDPRVREAEVARASAVPTESMGAYHCLLRGLAMMNTLDDDDLARAGELMRRAIELDPNYAQAHAQLAWWHNLRVGEGRSPMTSEDARLAESLSRRAVELDPRDAVVLSVAAHVLSFVRGRPREAMDLFDRALAINPNCTLAWSRSATTQVFLGNGEQALDRVARAMLLSPFDPVAFTFNTTRGNASMLLGRYDEAVSWLGKARRLNPAYRAATRLLVAALALSGEYDEARAVAQELLEVEPAFRVSIFGAWYPVAEPYRSRLLDGMRKGGLPD